MKKIVFAFLLGALLMLQTFADAAFAGTVTYSSGEPDYSRRGSISVELLTGDQKPVSGGTLSAYFVAEAKRSDDKDVFFYIEPFGDETEILNEDTFGTTKEDVSEMTQKLARKTSDAVCVQTVTVDGRGRAVFSDLPLGMYLIVQEEAAEGWNPIESFLVTVPMYDGADYIYDVDASPKLSVAHEEEKPPESENPPENPPPSQGKLPQTGVFWWPVVLLLAGDFMLFGTGVRMRRSYN